MPLKSIQRFTLLLICTCATAQAQTHQNTDTSQNPSGSTGTCIVSSAPQSAIPALRFLRIFAGDSGFEQAIRVTFMDLPVPFDVANDVQMWVGPPLEVCENTGQGPEVDLIDCGPTMGFSGSIQTCGGAIDGSDPLCGVCANGSRINRSCVTDDDCLDGVCLICAKGECILTKGPTYFTALLQCEPHYMDWTTIPKVINVSHESIVPSGTYVVQVIDISNPISLPECYSVPLVITNPIYGDVRGFDCVEEPPINCSPPDGSVDVTVDVTSFLEGFKNSKFSLGKGRLEIEPGNIDYYISITDVTNTLSAFQGYPYPYAPYINQPCP